MAEPAHECQSIRERITIEIIYVCFTRRTSLLLPPLHRMFCAVNCNQLLRYHRQASICHCPFGGQYWVQYDYMKYGSAMPVQEARGEEK